MKGSLLVLAAFALGCLAGWGGLVPAVLKSNAVSLGVLYLLMFEVGLSIGSDSRLKEILSSVRPKLLLLPLATVIGTLAGAAAVGFFLSRWSIFDALAVGSGFGYYSLSSILIVQLKEAALGAHGAAELGTVALMSNMIREMLTLLCAPWLVKYFGKLAPICAGGVTSMDVTLPVVSRVSGKEWAFAAIFHGVLLDLSVPFFVSFFCSLG